MASAAARADLDSDLGQTDGSRCGVARNLRETGASWRVTAAEETERFKNELALPDFREVVDRVGERDVPERARATAGLTPV
jgi:hypothetical protein